MFGTVLKLLLMKDLKSTFRQKKLLIIEILLFILLVPGFIAFTVIYPKHANPKSDEEIKQAPIQHNLTLSPLSKEDIKQIIEQYGSLRKVFRNKIDFGANVSEEQEIIYLAMARNCSELFVNDNIVVYINNLSNETFDYKLILHDHEDVVWHNEPHMVPDVFGFPAQNFTFNENEDAFHIQLCLNKAYLLYLSEEYGHGDTWQFINEKYDVALEEINEQDPLENVAPIHLLELLTPILINIPSVITVRKIYEEKENNIHTFMVVMGLDRSLFILSHLIFTLIKMYLYMFPIGITVAVCIDQIGWLIFILFFLYSHVFISLMFLISSLTKNSTVLVFAALSVFGTNFLLINDFTLFTIFDTTWASVASFFIPQMAFKMGLTHLSFADLHGQPIHFFDAPHYIPLCVPIFALLFQAIFLLLLAFYFDAVIPIDDSPKKHPLFFIGRKYDNVTESQREKEMQALMQQDQEENAFNQMYFENDKSEAQADIDVFRVSKKWSNERYGVQDITFKAYPNQVTALLGHNGAGKSTTFAILSGLTKITAGKVYVCGQEPRTLSDNPNVGFCPQWDPLFPHLTVREHLGFYQILKGVDDPAEIEEMLQRLGLTDFANYRTMFLTGGVKRKLCVGMAMIGNSKVIILDEPTHGMDTLSRKQLIEIIRTAKYEHTILLATHYMDEADAVSDRIIILSNGRIICNGSSNFLKAKVGTGFLLTVDFTNAIGPESYQEFAEAVLAFVQVHCKEAKIHGHVHQQFTIFLPNDTQKLFPAIFSDLETQKAGLEIASFDIRTNTLERVFIKITDEAESNKSREPAEIVQEIYNKRVEFESCCTVFWLQVFALLIRKFHYTRRHYFRSAIPLLTVIMFAIYLLLSVFGPKTTVWQKEESTEIATYPAMTIVCYYDVLKDCDAMKELPKNVRVLKRHFEAVLEDEKSLIYFDKAPLTFKIKPVESDLRIWYRNGFPNGVPVALTTMFNYYHFGKDTIKTNISIESVNNHGKHKFATVIFLFLYVLYPILFSIPIFMHVEEIGRGIVHIYQRTQMSLFTYWFASFIFDMFYALIPILLQVILIVAFDDGIVLTEGFGVFSISGVFLNALVFLLQSYVASIMFKSSTLAVVSLLLYNIILSYVCIIAFIKMQLQKYLIFPALFCPTILFQIIFTPVPTHDPYGVCMLDAEHSCLGTFYLIISGNVLFYLTILLIWNLRSHICSCQGTPADLTPYKENIDVLEEKRKVESLGPDAFQIYTLNLRKTYSGLVAVRDITMGVAGNECFGLLGANGAGKSTFFNMLTATMKPSSGEGYVGSVDIRKQPLFGFCPQISRFVPELSVGETLNFFARLKGIILKEEFLAIISEGFFLFNIKDTRVGKLTLGELRRLNIAIALLTSPEIVMLDEPTTGVDPRSRRHIWELLISLRTTGSSQLLTSHSMEECEALCTKIGFINHGVFIGIGTSQHLKNRFGNSHRLTIVLKEPSEILAEKLNYEFHVIFNATPLSVAGNVPDLIWSIPKTSESLSQLYTRLNQFVESQPKLENGENPIKDFAIVGTSLEDIFAAMVDTKIEYEFRF